MNLLKSICGPQIRIPDPQARKGLYAMQATFNQFLSMNLKVQSKKKINTKLQIIPNRFLYKVIEYKKS